MTEIIQQLQNIISAGDEKAVRQFIVEHIKEFPEKIRNNFIFAFFSEALAKDARTKETQVEIMNEARGELQDLEKITRNIAEKQRILELHKKIGGARQSSDDK